MTRPELLAACVGGISSTAEMAQKTHDGLKTHTMRVMEPQPDRVCEYCGKDRALFSSHHTYSLCCPCGNLRRGNGGILRPKYKPGDILYVREPWEHWSGTCTCVDQEFLFECGPDDCDTCKYTGPAMFAYEADLINLNPNVKFGEPDTMPPEAARTFIRITGVEAKRPRDMADREMIAEGCPGEPCDHFNGRPCTDCMNSGWLEPPWVEFLDTFYSIYPPEQHGKNPWCWGYTYEILRCSE